MDSTFIKVRANASLKSLARAANWAYIKARSKFLRRRKNKHVGSPYDSMDDSLHAISENHYDYAKHLCRLAKVDFCPDYDTYRAKHF